MFTGADILLRLGDEFLTCFEIMLRAAIRAYQESSTLFVVGEKMESSIATITDYIDVFRDRIPVQFRVT